MSANGARHPLLVQPALLLVGLAADGGGVGPRVLRPGVDAGVPSGGHAAVGAAPPAAAAPRPRSRGRWPRRITPTPRGGRWLRPAAAAGEMGAAGGVIASALDLARFRRGARRRAFAHPGVARDAVGAHPHAGGRHPALRAGLVPGIVTGTPARLAHGAVGTGSTRPSTSRSWATRRGAAHADPARQQRGAAVAQPPRRSGDRALALCDGVPGGGRGAVRGRGAALALASMTPYRVGVPTADPGGRSCPPPAQRSSPWRCASTPWKRKLHLEQLPQVIPDPRGRMLIPTPLLVARALRRVAPGLRPHHAGDPPGPPGARGRRGLRLPHDDRDLPQHRRRRHGGGPRRGRPLAPYWRVVDDRGGCRPVPLRARRGRRRTSGPRDTW